MDTWRSTYLGLRELPRELTAFEVQTFFTFSIAEREAIAQRRSATHQLGLALHIGFMRMSGRLLDAFRVLPPNLWRHLGEHLGVQAPEVASLRGMYKRGRTLYDHHQVACEVLGFAWMSEGQRRALVRALSDELHRCIDRERLLVFARHWLYERRLIVAHERTLRSTIAAAAKRHEHELAARIGAQVDAPRLAGWRKVPIQPHRSGLTRQTWLWQAPARHSTRQIAEVLERIEFLYELGVQQHLGDVPDLALRRYARRLARRKPSVAARIQEPGRTVEVACFLRYCLLVATDQLILMVRRRVADLWRQAAAATPDSVNWADLYRQLLGELTQLAGADAVSDSELRTRLASLVLQNQQRKPPSRAQLIRARLTDAVGPIRSLLAALCKLPWQAQGEHPVVQALGLLRDLYARNKRHLPADVSIRLGPVWRDAITGYDRERAFRALEVATLFALRRALRNGSVWIEHSLSFRSREQLFIASERWQTEAKRHYARLALPVHASAFLTPLLERVRGSLEAVAAAQRAGILRIDDDLHLAPLAADEEAPEIARLRARLDQRIGEVQLPELILAVDAQVRFSWIMLGREPRSTDELLMVYAGILANGTALSAAETARMMPQLSAGSVRQAMRWAGDEQRLAEACSAVLAYLQRHPIAATWGRADLASSDMMSLETQRRVWQARLDPRRQTPAIGIYTHVRDRWGIFYAQPIVLNERQAGAAIEGVVRAERIETSQLAVDTHGYTDFAMALARLLGFDLCPRLKELKRRRLYVPSGSAIAEEIRAICVPNVNVEAIELHWDALIHLTASVHSGHASAVAALARFGSAARGDPIYEAGVQLGRLLRTVFLADYFVNAAFRRELLRVLNRGEAVNALKRAIYSGRVAGYQAKRDDEMQAVADALSLLANIVMAWNTAQIQAILDRWANRRQLIAAQLLRRIAPTRIEGINLRGVFRFPVERFADQILPSRTASKKAAAR